MDAATRKSVAGEAQGGSKQPSQSSFLTGRLNNIPGRSSSTSMTSRIDASKLAAGCLQDLPDLQQAKSSSRDNLSGSRVMAVQSNSQYRSSLDQPPQQKQSQSTLAKTAMKNSMNSVQRKPAAVSRFGSKHDVEAGVPIDRDSAIKGTAQAEDIVDEGLMRKAGGKEGVISFREPRWKKWLSIRTTIIVLFMTALIFNGLFIFIFMLLRNQENVMDLATQIQDTIIQDITDRLLTRLRAAESLERTNVAMIRAGTHNVETVSGLQAYAESMQLLLTANPNTSSDAYVFPLNENGGGCWGAIFGNDKKLQKWNATGTPALPDNKARFYTWGHDENGDYNVLVSNASAWIDYDDPTYEMVYNVEPRINPGAMLWSSPWVIDNRPYVTLSMAAINPAGVWVGIAGTDIALGSISPILREVATSASSDAILLIVNRKDGMVVGASDRDLSYRCDGRMTNSVCDGTVSLLKPDSQYFPQSYHDADRIVIAEYGGWDKVHAKRIFTGDIDGQAKFLNVAPLDTGASNLQWAVVLMINQSDFLSGVTTSRNVAIGVFCGLLAVSIALTFVFAMGITKPLADVTDKMNSLFKAKAEKMAKLLEEEGTESVRSTTTVYEDSNLVEIRLLQGMHACKFVHPLVVQRIVWNEPGAADICVTRKEVSIFFSDIKDFTVLSERLPVAVLITILSKYLGFMTEIIARYDGIVADFIGDAIMAFWEDSPNHATLAVQCALDQQAAMATFNQMLAGKGYEPMSVRMGLHVGTVLVGNIGSVHRLKYGCVGDDVNLCSRLEGLNKRYNTNIVLSDEMARQLPPLFETRALEQVIVKGRSTATYLHELCGTREGVSPAIAERNLTFDALRKRVEVLEDVEGEEGMTLLEEVERYLMNYPGDTAGALLRDRLTSGHLSGPVKLMEK
ncbi:uncharacterized protein EV422DRAFT_518571 [Fimicolochytrium jonesii]|uniref:uncharacterized protein n=1 Tax=Fimicolochytrium jonesii TaxID=1396493 RepID=UPI0022FF245B|nr:uncharacterized protein EV422DRAFT_518571 [Fimicolochytrium jonesii]KAI8824003.1 hypothetical protein EV422DRAFT_518571 [Fimicolochytrium jonesii]